jgi:hypothetical protein
VRDEYEVVADDVDAEGGEEEEDHQPELPIGVGSAPVGRTGLVGGLVGFGGGICFVGFDFAHGV